MKEWRNKDILYELYWEKELNGIQIAKKLGAGRTTIYTWMQRFGIQKRSLSEARLLTQGNHLDLGKVDMNLMNGLLLGDGGLGVNYKKERGSPRFAIASKHREYLEFLSKKLRDCGVQQVGKIRKQIHKKCNNAVSYGYSSKSYIEFHVLRNLWYVNRKKVVPKNIELTPECLREWLIGDGCFNTRDKNLMFCTNGFSIGDAKFLIKKFTKLGFIAKMNFWRKQPIIRISTRSTPALLDYIAPCYLELEHIWGYKWGHWKLRDKKRNL